MRIFLRWCKGQASIAKKGGQKMRFVFGLMCLIFAGSTAWACGPNSKCRLGDRHYYIALPEGHDGRSQVGAILFSHGLQGTAKGVMGNETLRGIASELGVALIAVKSIGEDWTLPNGPRNAVRNVNGTFRYFDAVVRDATSRFPIDPDRMMATGYSAGGMVTWNLVCQRPQLFAAFAPMAGTFWKNPPRRCRKPVANVLHIHGLTDKTVPMEGRVINGVRQGNVTKVMRRYKRMGRFRAAGRSSNAVLELSCKLSRNRKGKMLDLCLYPGRHKYDSRYVEFAWKHFVKAGVL